MSGPAPQSARKVVLIVEDEEPIAQAMAFIVEDAGYGAEIASNGKVALKMIAERMPDLIITDLMMPQMSGKELITVLRERRGEQGDPPPIVIMTAAARSFAEDIDADAVLPKPFEITQVEAILRQFLG